VSLVGFVALALLLPTAPPAEATPGYWYWNYLWFKPGSTNINGNLRYYKNGVTWANSTAGSGLPNQGECVSNAGRIPNGWYNSGNDHHVHNKNNLIKGRVWGLQDKVCSNGVTLRTELFIHTEETSTNGQSCPTAADDPYCWETAADDYKSIGCVKNSYPAAGFLDSVSTLNNWWDVQVGGGHGVAYSSILYVGPTAPPPPA
jgi:hypothetical protein